MHFSIQPTFEPNVVLKRRGDWDDWIIIVEALAKRRAIEKFVDLTTGYEPVEPARPAPPTPAFVKVGAQSVAELSADEKLDYTILLEDFEEVLATYKEAKKALKELEHHILSTTDRKNLRYLKGQGSVYKMLLALKTRLAPMDSMRILEVRKRYRALLRAPKAQNLDRWLLDWERTYFKACQLGLPEIENHKCLYDFLNALRAVDMHFVAGEKAVIEYQIRVGMLPTLEELLESYRIHLLRSRSTR